MTGEHDHDYSERQETCKDGDDARMTEELYNREARNGRKTALTLQCAREDRGKNPLGNPGRLKPCANQRGKAPFFLIVVPAGGTEPRVFTE
jgi:uncharacterized protein YhfF